jgi:hypothetical protein
MTTRKPLALREWKYPRIYRTVFAREPRGIYQADVMELCPLWRNIFNADEREIYRPKDYALVCIDVYSRYVWAVAMDKQDSQSTADAIKKIFEHMGIPKIFQGDKKVTDSYRKHLKPIYLFEITLFSTKPHETNKNAIFERAIRTLKNDLIKYLYFNKFPTKSEDTELDPTTKILQEICTLRNRSIHRTIREKSEDVFYGRALNRQIIIKKKYPKFNQGDLVFAKPLRERGVLGFKIFNFDYDIYIILVKEDDKYKLKSQYYFIHEKNTVKRRWYKPYEIRKITPQQALDHLNSPLVQQYLAQKYEDSNAVKDIRDYIQSRL